MNSLWSSLEPQELKIKKELKDVPPSSIASAEDGEEIKIVGPARCDVELLSSPFSGGDCFGWEVIVETLDEDRYGRPGMASLGWYEVFRKHLLLPFSIDDGSGVAFVDDPFLELMLVKDATYTEESDEGLRAKIEDFVEEHESEGAQRLSAFRRLRVREGTIARGETIGVLGSGRWEVDNSGMARAAGYRSAARRLIIEPNQNDDLFVTDDPELTE